MCNCQKEESMNCIAQKLIRNWSLVIDSNWPSIFFTRREATLRPPTQSLLLSQTVEHICRYPLPLESHFYMVVHDVNTDWYSFCGIKNRNNGIGKYISWEQNNLFFSVPGISTYLKYNSYIYIVQEPYHIYIIFSCSPAISRTWFETNSKSNTQWPCCIKAVIPVEVMSIHASGMGL